MGVGAALLAIGRGLRDVWRNGYAYIWANVAFFILCLPIVTAPAAYAALCRVCREAQTQPWEADLALFWETFRARFWRALAWGLVMALLAFVNFSNLLAYGGRDEPLWVLLRVLWWACGVVWWGVVCYTWFVYDEMEQPSVWGATRNAFVMVLLNPVFTLCIIAAQTFIVILSIMMPPTFALLTFGVITAISAAAVQSRLSVYRQNRASGS